MRSWVLYAKNKTDDIMNNIRWRRQMIEKIKLLISAVVLLASSLLSGTGVLAADANNEKYMMIISPPRQRIILMPGEVYEGSINVSNSFNAVRDLKYSVHIGSFNLGKDEDGNADYDFTDVNTITSYNQIMNWITLGKESGVVAPGETDVLPYTINVPEDAPAGGQYATIIFHDSTNDDDVKEGNVMIQNVVEFAAGIFADVAGQTREEGVIVENNIPLFILTNELVASSVVKNNGNVHTDAEYILQFWPLFSDEEVCTNEEEPETSMIMPETERYHAQTCNLPSFGIFRAKQTVKIFGETSIVEKTIIVCPLWLLFIIIFVIVALIIWLITKSKARKQLDKE